MDRVPTVAPEAEAPPAPPKRVPPPDVLFGTGAGARDLAARLEAVAATDLPVVLQGEAGTGKELAARWMHELSPFSAGGFVRATCVGGPDEDGCHLLIDDARLPARGGLLDKLRALNTGTLFLDDVENLAVTTQALLSRVLQEGLDAAINVDAREPLRFRIISATRNDLRAQSDGLRPEFFHTISAFTARMYPLRERTAELPRLTAYFIRRHSKEMGLERPLLSSPALNVLREYPWPGNFHELENMLISYVLTGSEELLMERVRALTRSPEIEAGAGALLEWPSGVAHPVGRRGAQSRGPVIDDQEILRALKENRWNRRQAASRLHMSYRSLLNRLKKIDTNAGRAAVYKVAPGRG